MKKIIFVLLFSFLFSKLYAEGAIKVIARVNDQIITSKDLDDYYTTLSFKVSDEQDELDREHKFKGEALERFINDKLILVEAKKEIANISQDWVENKIKQLMLSYSSREEFENSLIDKGLTTGILRAKIKDQYLMRQIIEKNIKSKISISPQELSKYYEENKDKMNSLPTYAFYMASSKDVSVLNQIKDVIEAKGLDEALVVHQSSLVRLEVAQSELKEEIFSIISSLSSKELIIKKIDESYYLIYLESLIEPYLMPLVEVKETIYASLWQDQFKRRFTEWVVDLRKNAVIENYYE